MTVATADPTELTLVGLYVTSAAEHELRKTIDAPELRRQLRKIVRRHTSGDWGDVDKHDWKVNDQAVRDGRRIVSAYTVAGVKLWIISDAAWTDDPLLRETTTILRPEDY